MKKVYFGLLGLMIIHIIILMNLQFTAWPETFSFPYLFNSGFDLYKDMVHPYTPLLTMSLSFLYKLFGYNVWVVKLFTYFLILVNDLLIFKITSKLTKESKWGIVAVIFYCLTQPFLEGNQLWFDFAISTPILLGLWFIIDKKYLLSGVALTIAFLTKQNSALFLIFGLILIYVKEKKIMSLSKYVLGGFLTVLPFAFYLFSKSTFVDFMNWALIYPSKYWTSFPNYVQMIPSNRQLLTLIFLFLPALYLIFKKEIKHNILLFGSLLISLILIYPRFSFFHFQTGLVFLSITFGVASSKLKNMIYIYLYLVILSLLITKDWGHSIRFIDDNKLSIEKSEKVYLLGPHSLNYVVNNSLPPKPWIDNYGWYFEIPGIQHKMIDGWKIDPPKYVYISKSEPGSWYDLGTYQPDKIVNYINMNYQKVDEMNDVEVWKLK